MLCTYVDEFENQSTQNMDIAEFVIEDLLKSRNPQETLIFEQLFKFRKDVLNLEPKYIRRIAYEVIC